MRPLSDPAQGELIQRVPSARAQRGHDFEEAPIASHDFKTALMRSRTGAISTKRLQCAHA